MIEFYRRGVFYSASGDGYFASFKNVKVDEIDFYVFAFRKNLRLFWGKLPNKQSTFRVRVGPFEFEKTKFPNWK